MEWHRALAEEGDETRAWKERPDLAEHLQILLDAFYDLSASRVYTTVGPAPIPISEVLAYCQLVGMTDLDDRTEFLRLMRRMDASYLEDVRSGND